MIQRFEATITQQATQRAGLQATIAQNAIIAASVKGIIVSN